MKYGIPIDMTQNELQNAVLHKLAGAPSSPVEGQVYTNSGTHIAYYWNLTEWVPMDARARTNIPNSALATDPLARANHTGTQTASTISDFDTQVRSSRLDQMTAPTASVSFNSQKLTNLGAPTAGSNDAARIVDVETAVQSAAAGIDNKPSVRALANTNITLSGAQTIDGVSVIAGDRVLVRGQSTASQNGSYVAAAGAWSRATDGDATGELTPGAFWYVEEGTTYGKTQWRIENTGAITVGSTAITINQFGAAAGYTEGDGILFTGNIISVEVVSGGALVVGASGVDIDVSKVVQKKAFLIGDGVATSFTCTHNLNNQDVITQVREVATNEVWGVGIQNNGVNTVVISFSSAPATNSFRVVVQG